MKVKAKKLGYYNNKRQHAGTEFALTDASHFSKNWMERLDAEEDAPVQAKRGPGRPVRTEEI